MERFDWQKMPAPALLRTPLGRRHLIHLLFERNWHLLLRLAIQYRRKIVPRTRVVAIVGSAGKSTTTRAVTAALATKLRQPFHNNFRSFVARAVLKIRPFDRHAVIEVGIRGRNHMARYAELLRPDITVVTSIGSDHHLSLGTIEATRQEKSKMVQALPSSGLAVLNGDDPNVLWMADCTKARIITYGLNPKNDVYATDIALDWPRGTRFTLHAQGERCSLLIRLWGQHMVYCALAATAVALAEGFGLNEIIPRLESLTPAPGRLELIQLENGAIILRDDIKASVETIDSAFDMFAQVPAKRKVVVMGVLSEITGNQDPKYRSVGERIGKIASRAIFVVDHRDKYKPYANGASSNGIPKHEIHHARTVTDSVLSELRKELGPGDVVIVKGQMKQRLERVALVLKGRAVKCGLTYCDAKAIDCETCPMLERGWNGVAQSASTAKKIQPLMNANIREC